VPSPSAATAFTEVVPMSIPTVTSPMTRHYCGMQLAGASVLVTGASSGIGAALAPMLAQRGARVGLVARRKERLEGVLEQCKRHDADARMWVADLGVLEAAVQVVQEADEAFGGLDVLVNNAGIPKRRAVTGLTFDEVDETMRVNYLSPVRMSLALLPGMLERGRGCIVNVTSIAGRLGVKREAAYCGSKFALTGWTEAMAVDLWDTPIEIRLVLPGAIDTEIWDLPGNDPPIYDGPKESAESVAEGIVAAIEGDQFEHYLPDMKAIIEYKTSNVQEFLGGVASM
jgi:short-subunit dehydrogenase